MPPPLTLERATDTPACTADGSRSSLVPQSWLAVTFEAGDQRRLTFARLLTDVRVSTGAGRCGARLHVRSRKKSSSLLHVGRT